MSATMTSRPPPLSSSWKMVSKADAVLAAVSLMASQCVLSTEIIAVGVVVAAAVGLVCQQEKSEANKMLN
jgi:hypothetical protein